MRTYRRLWRTTAGATALLAVGGSLVAIPATMFLAIVFTTVTFGALLALVFKEDLVGVRHPAVAGAVLATAPVLCPGLEYLLGPAAFGLAAVLVLASPSVVRRADPWLRRWLLPSRLEQAGMADPDEGLRRQWVESTRQLAEATSVADRMLVVQARRQILDDLTERTGGELPAFVWATPDGKVAS